VKTSGGATSGVIGICTAGCGTSGTATIQIAGTTSCVFDATATTAGDYVQISATAGDCHDAGSSVPTSGQIIGRVLSTNSAGGGTYSIALFTQELYPGPSGATGVTGATGPSGATGVTGATGTAGTNGTNGATGATGAAGVAGATGSTGPAGPSGATGASGGTFSLLTGGVVFGTGALPITGDTFIGSYGFVPSATQSSVAFELPASTSGATLSNFGVSVSGDPGNNGSNAGTWTFSVCQSTTAAGACLASPLLTCTITHTANTLATEVCSDTTDTTTVNATNGFWLSIKEVPGSHNSSTNAEISWSVQLSH